MAESRTSDVKAEQVIACPSCSSQAVYKYGHVRSAKQRYICMLCGRQFVPPTPRYVPKYRPRCPQCGARTYLFKRTGKTSIVYRCCRYPECRSYVKVEKKGEHL